MNASVSSQIAAVGMLPVITIDGVERAEQLGHALVRGGLPVVEITFRTAAAASAIAIIRMALPDMLIGAGTVLTREALRAAKDAGADFALAPGTNRDILAEAREIGIPFFPGVCTPSDIEAALSMGARILKFFPAEAEGGIEKLETVAAPYAGERLKFIPTGGIKSASLATYLASDVVVAVGGSWIASRNMIAEERWSEISGAAAEAVAVTRKMRPN